MKPSWYWHRWKWDGTATFLEQASWLALFSTMGASFNWGPHEVQEACIVALLFWCLRVWRIIRVDRGAELTGEGWETEKVFKERDALKATARMLLQENDGLRTRIAVLERG
jgi:hypothetical protein